MKATYAFVIAMLWLAALASTSAVPAADRPAPSFAGPLRVHPDNPRYFTDDTGCAIYLTGSHTWRTVQDAGTNFPPTAFGFFEFLDLVGKHNHNFIRLWVFEGPAWVRPDSTILWLDPLPFERTGPGMAADGRPKFDVTRFNQAFFDRLRSRVVAAGARGMYVGVMLFQGFSVARKMDLAAMTPHGDLTSTKYCLAAPGKEYLVYQPGKSPFRVQLSGSKTTTFAVEWFDPQAGMVVDGKPVKMMEQTTFAPPFSGDAVLYLKAR